MFSKFTCTLAFLLFGPFACWVALRSDAQSAAPRPNAPKAETPKTQYGAIVIEKYNRVHAEKNFSGVHFSGPHTLATIPYPRSASVLVIHADEITTKAAGGDQFANATLNGNVRYTMKQKIGKDVFRTVTGTAERATFNHKAERIEMDGSVLVALTDPERLAAPGEIHAGHAVVEMEKSPYVYTLTGEPDANDIRFTAREDAPQSGEKPNVGPKKNGVGSIHVHGYDRGIFQVGQAAHFAGGGTTIELSGKGDQSQAEIRAASFDADFTEKRSALKNATAKGGVRYRITRPEPPRTAQGEPQGNPPPAAPLDSVTGRSDTMEYDAALTKFTLAGNVDADILAPGSLVGPAKIRVDRLIAHTAAPFTYELKSAAKDSLIAFTPIPPKPTPPKNPKPQSDKEPAGKDAPKPHLALGSVKISRFDYGMYAPAKGVRLTVAQGKMLFESDDAATLTTSRILARDITADLTEDNLVSAAKATGGIEFRVRQTDPKTKIAQVIEGTAPEIAYASNEPGSENETRSLSMPGPFRAAVTDPNNLVEPGTLTGLAGDKLILRVTGEAYEYDIESVNETAVIDLKPTPKEKKPDETPAPGKKPATPTKKTKAAKSAKK